MKDNKKLRRITLMLLIVKLVCDVISLISYQRKDKPQEENNHD